MISIAGLGISGGYLFRRMKLDGFEVEGYDPKAPDFYVPCGYATNRHKFGSLLKNVNMDVDDFLLSEAKEITISTEKGRELTFQSRGLCTIDKNRLESEMISEFPIYRERLPEDAIKNGIIIDATGVSRYYLGQAAEDFLMYTKEFLTGRSPHTDFYFRYFSSGKGYYWEFPMNGKYHVGAGGESTEIVAGSVDWVEDREKIASRKIRLRPLFDQMFRENVIGVGEAIGTVSPITGEGILPSMESAEIFFQCLKKYDDIETLKENYRSEIQKEFRRYDKLFQLLIDTRNGELMKAANITAIKSAKEDFENFGMELKIWKVLRQLTLR